MLGTTAYVTAAGGAAIRRRSRIAAFLWTRDVASRVCGTWLVVVETVRVVAATAVSVSAHSAERWQAQTLTRSGHFVCVCAAGLCVSVGLADVDG